MGQPLLGGFSPPLMARRVGTVVSGWPADVERGTHGVVMATRRTELDAMLRRAKALPSRDQLARVEGLLTPAMQLRLIVRQVRRQTGPRDERRIDQVVDRAVRKVRGERAARR
jgi:hypothetical protein